MNLHCQKAWQDEVRDSISVSMCKFNLQALPLAASAPAETPLSAFSNNADEDEIVGAMPLAVQAPSESTIPATSTIADGIESVAETVPSLAVTTALSSTAIQVEADEPLPVAVNTALEVGAVGSPPVYVTAPLKPAPTIPSRSVKNESADKLPLAETTSNLVSPPVDTSNGFNSTESVQTGVELISGLNATAIVPSNTDVQGERLVDLVGLDLDGCSCHLDTEMVDVETKLLADEKPASSMETTKRRRSRRGSRKSRSKKQQLPLEKTSKSATSLTMEITSSTNCEAVCATSRTPLLTPHHEVDEGLPGTQSLGGTLPSETIVSPPTPGIEMQVLSNQPKVACAKSQSPTYVPADSAVAVDLTETKQSLTPLETEMEVESVDMVPVAEQAVKYVAEVQSVGPLLQFEAELVEPTSVAAESVLSQTSVVETPNRVVDVETVEVVAVDTAVEAQEVAAPPVNVTEPPTKTVALSVSPPGKTGVELHLGFDAAVNVSSTADVKRESSCHVMDVKMVDADSKLLVKERLDTSSETTKLRKIRRGSRKRRSKKQLSLEKTSTPPTSQAVTCDVPLPTTFIEVDTALAGTEQFIGTARSETSVSLQTPPGTDLEACDIQPEVACVQSVTATPALPDCAEDVDLAEAKQLSTPPNSELEGESIELAAVVEASSSSQTLVAEPSKEASEKDPAVVLAELAFGVLRRDVEEVAAPPVVTEPLMEAAPRSLSPTIGTSTRLGVTASAETGPELMCDSTASVSANNDDDLELIFAPVAVISKPLLTGPCKNVVVVETVDGKGNIVVEVQEVVASQVCQTELPAESAPQPVSPPVGTAELVETGVELVLATPLTAVCIEVEDGPAGVEQVTTTAGGPETSVSVPRTSEIDHQACEIIPEAADVSFLTPTPAPPDCAEDVKLAVTKQLDAPLNFEMRVDDMEAAETPVEEEGVTKFVGNPSYNAVEVQSVDPCPEMNAEPSLLEVAAVPSKTPVTEPSNNAADVEAVDALVGEGIVVASTAVGVETALDGSFTAFKTESEMATSANVTSDAEFQGRSPTDLMEKCSHHSDTEMVDVESKLLVDEKLAASVEATKRRRSRRRSRKSAARKQQMPLEKTSTPLKSKDVEATPLTALCVEVDDGPAGVEQVTVTAGRPETSVSVPRTSEIDHQACEIIPEAADVLSLTPTPAPPDSAEDVKLTVTKQLDAPLNFEMRVDDMEAAETPVEEEGVTKFVGNPSYNAVEVQSVDPCPEMDAEPSLLAVVSVLSKTPVTEPSNNAADVEVVDVLVGEGIVAANTAVKVETMASQPVYVDETLKPVLAGSFTAFHTESEMATSANVTSDVEFQGKRPTDLVDKRSCHSDTEMVDVESKLLVDEKPAASVEATKRRRSRRRSRKSAARKQQLPLEKTSTPLKSKDVEATPLTALCVEVDDGPAGVEQVTATAGRPETSVSVPRTSEIDHQACEIIPEAADVLSLTPTPAPPDSAEDVKLTVTKQLDAPLNFEMRVDDMEAAETPVEEEGVTKFVGNPSYNAVELQSVDPCPEMDAEPSLLEVVSVLSKTPVAEPSNNAADLEAADVLVGEGIVPANTAVEVETMASPPVYVDEPLKPLLAGSLTAYHTESEMAASASATSDIEFQRKSPTDLMDKCSRHSDTEMVDVESKLLVDEKPAASVEATKCRRSRRCSCKGAARKQQMPLEKTSTPLKSKAVEATPLTAPCTEVEDGPAGTEQVTATARPEMSVSLQMTPEIDLQACEIIPEAADVSSLTPTPPPPDCAEDVKLAVTKQLVAPLNFEMRVDDTKAAETPVEEEGVTKFVGNPSYNAVEVQSVDPLPEIDAEPSLLEVVSVPSKTPVTEPSNNAADVEAVDALVGEGIVVASTAVGVETALDGSFTAFKTESEMATSANVTSDAEFQGRSPTDLMEKCSHHSDTEMVDVESKLLVDEKPAASVEATKRRRSRRRSRKSAARKQQMPLEKTSTPLKSKAVEATPLTALCIEVEDGPAEQVTATAGRPEASVCVPTTPEIVLEACDNQPEAADVPSRTPTPALPVGEADADLAEAKQLLTPFKSELEAESIELAAVVEASSLSPTLVAEPSKKASEKDPAVVLAELAFGVMRTDVEEVAAPPVVTEPLMETAPRSLSPTIGSSTRLGVTASAETGPELMCDSTASVSANNDDDLELIFAPVAVISKPLLTGPCKNVVVVETVDGKGNIVVEVQEVVAPQVCQTELPAESAPQTVSPPVGTAELVETGVELVLGKDAALNEPSVANEVEGESATHLVDNYSCNLGTEMVAVETKLPVDKKPASSLHTTKRQRSRRGSCKSGSKKQRLTLKETSTTPAPHTTTSEAACSEAPILTPAAPDSAEDVKLAETKQLSAPSYTEMEIEPTPMAVASASCQSLIAHLSNNSVQVESVVSVHGVPIQSRSSCALPVIKAAPSGCSLPPSTDTEHVLPVITMPESLPGSSLVGETPSSTASESAIVVGSVVVEIGSLDSLPSEGPVSFVGWKSSDSKVSDQDPLGSRNPSLRKVRPTLGSGRSSCKGVSRKWGVLKDQAKPESDTSSTICNTLGTISKPDELECGSSNEQLVPETVISYIPVCPPATSDMNIDIGGGLQFSTAEVLAPLVLTNVEEKKSAKDILKTVVDTQSVERETEKVHVDTSPFQGQKRGSNELKRGKKRKRSSCNKGINVDSVAAYVEVTTSPATESVESSKNALVLNHPAKDMLEYALPVGETAPTVPSDTLVTKQAAEAMMECALPGSETAPTVPSNTLVSFQAAKAMLESAFSIGETAPTVPSDTSYTKQAAEAMLECALPVGETAPTVPSNTLVSFQEAKAVLECAFSVGETAPTVPSDTFYTKQAAEAMLEFALPVGETAPTVPSHTLHMKQAAEAMLECALPVGETASTVSSNTLVSFQAAKAVLESAFSVGETAPSVPSDSFYTQQAAEAMLECALPVGETAPTVPSDTLVTKQAAEAMMECALPVGETAPTVPSDSFYTQQAAEAMLECALPVGESAPTVPSNTLYTKQAAEAMLECALPVGETAPTVPSNTLYTKQAAEAMLECALPVGETAPTVPSNTLYTKQAAEAMLECALPVGETAPTVPSNTLYTKQAAEAMLECALPVGETAPTVPSNTWVPFQAAKAVLEHAFSVGETAPTVPSNTFYMKQAAEAMLECALTVGETAPTVPNNNLLTKQGAEDMLECALPVGETAPTVPSNTLHTKRAAEAMLECALPVGETSATVPSDTLVTKQAVEAMMECALPVGETAPTVPSNTFYMKQAAEAMFKCALPVGETAPTVPSKTLHMKQAAEAMLECASPVNETAPAVPSNTRASFQAAKAVLERAFSVGEAAPTVPSKTLHMKQAAEAMLECASPVNETASAVPSNTRASFQAAKAALEHAFSVGEAAPTVPSKTLHMKQAAEAMLECASPVSETAPAVPSDTLMRKQVSGAMLECVLPVCETALPVTNNALGESKERSCGAPEIKQTRKRKRSDLESEDRDPQKSSQKEEGCEDSQKVDSETVDEIIKPLEIKTNRQKSKSKRASQKSGRKKLQSVPQRSEGDSVAVASSSTEPLPDQNGTTKSDSSPVLPETEMVCMGGMSQSISSVIVISNEAAEMSALLEAVRAWSLSNCMIIPNQIIQVNQSLGLL